MAMNKDHRKTLHALLLASYAGAADFDLLLQRDLGLSLGDLTEDGTRPQMYIAAIAKLDALRKIPDLFTAIFEDRPDDAALRDKLADLYNAIWPEGEPDKPHQHLLVDNVAFVNRDHLRMAISDLVDNGAPRVILLRGRSLAGTSHSRCLIQHVANERGGIEVAYVNFDWVQPLTPPMAMQALADVLNLGAPEQRIDLIGVGGVPDPESPQLAATLCNWFLGKARERIRLTNQRLWLLIDNAHRDTVSAPMRELLVKLIQNVGSGMVKDIYLFVLGADQTLPVLLPFAVEVLDVPPLGRPDVVAYLASVLQRHKSLDAFATADLAADAILASCDLAQPTAEAMLAMTKGLTELVRRVR
jgi:hypothetical protein